MIHPVKAYLMHHTRKSLGLLAAISALGSVVLLPQFQDGVAQEVTSSLSELPAVNPDAQMLLESDDLIYDNDRQLVIASGNVQIAYDGYSLVADQVSYDRRSGRVLATGNVEILEPSGNRIFADEIDITDDFSDGFVGALKVETADNTRLAAESAERRDGEFTIFNNGVYTACEECKKDPTKPPLWQIRAKRVIIDNQTRAVRYEDASFEFFGVPVVRLHRFAHADPSVKRKSGFLFPRYNYTEELGHSADVTYFFNLAPNYDLTLSGRYYSRQGFLGQAEWRHRTHNGQYTVKFARIEQEDQRAFADESYVTVDELQEERKALMTTGRFQINPRWTFGWNGLFQSDENFARTYSLTGFSSRDETNEIYLTGLNDKNYFDIRVQDFLIQDQRATDFDRYADGTQTLNDQQAVALPSFDYNLVSGEDALEGQVSLDVNVTSVRRDAAQIINSLDTTPGRFTTVPLSQNPIETAANERFHGIRGAYTRASSDLQWKNSVITDPGAVVTASLGLRADAIFPETDDLNTEVNPLTSNDSIFRAMPTGALEIRYPLIAEDGFASQIFEPIAQIIVRPDETHIGQFPNEDAQSMVFDYTNLFDLDKFSGFDRVEGGTRANIGFRYSVNIDGGPGIDLVAGQSFHLAGQNSFAQRDLVNAGQESGLETDRSDYVAGLQFDTGRGVTFNASGRFDESDFSVRRAEAGTQLASPIGVFSAAYIFTDEQPLYALETDRHEVKGSAKLNITENWSVFGSTVFDIYNDSRISKSIGLAYDDECYSFSLNYSQSRSRSGEAGTETIGFRFGLRTIGGYGHKFNLPRRDDG